MQMQDNGDLWQGIKYNLKKYINIGLIFIHSCQYFPDELNASKAIGPVYRFS